MSCNIKEDMDCVLGRRYNVEFEYGNGKLMTFNNVLTNVDGVYFWFSSKEDGLACIRQDRVTFMYCTDKK